MNNWVPREIIINEQIKNDSATLRILKRCAGVPIKCVENGQNTEIVRASETLRNANGSMLAKILAGKSVMYVAPAGSAVDAFDMPDTRMMCPHVDRLKLASNGCFYQCDWCYLKLTYRAAFPFITVRVQYDQIKEQIQKRINRTTAPVLFNSGELADSLALDHITGAGREFIPWFGTTKNGYLFMLTKSANVNDILNLHHNKHTIVTWSMNEASVSRRFEIGAPSLEHRLGAAEKVQSAGYPVRIRLDPIVPYEGWRDGYAETIRKIFDRISPERVTIGTLRFEEGFFKMRHSLLTSGAELSNLLSGMVPMFPAKQFAGTKRPKIGKYSLGEDQRTEIFGFIIDEIRKYSDIPIALCKESREVWNRLGMDVAKCQCVCQFEGADLSGRFTEEWTLRMSVPGAKNGTGPRGQ